MRIDSIAAASTFWAAGDQPGQFRGAMHDGDAERPAGRELGVVVLDGAADDHPRHAGTHARTILRREGDALAAQALERVRLVTAVEQAVRAGDGAPGVEQRLRQRAHADAADAREMHPRGTRRRNRGVVASLHVTGV